MRGRFPDSIASHSAEQDFYFGEDFLLRRHDYHVDVAGGFPAAQYVYDVRESEGLRFPTWRVGCVRDDDMQAIRERVMVSIDLRDFRFS